MVHSKSVVGAGVHIGSGSVIGHAVTVGQSTKIGFVFFFDGIETKLSIIFEL